MFCEQTEDNIEDLFYKKFDYFIPSLEADNKWILSTPIENGTKHFANATLLQLKNELNTLKSSLNDFDITEWNNHTTLTNPTSLVISEIKRNFRTELHTQAWCKFHEILAFADVLPEHALLTLKLNAVHLCEAPGAFICSLNHFLRSHHPKVKYKWIGNTLNPYYESNDPNSCIGDDRFIFQSLESWCFGSDNTGDIFERTTLNELQKRCQDSSIIHLITADGSVNCQERPENQEIDTAFLKYAELLYALSLLSPGGSFVLKIFTMFEYSSCVIMYVLCCAFSSVSVRKPATSKPGNSELYIVAKNFHGQDSCFDILNYISDKIFSNQGKDLEIVPVLNFPSDFIKQHLKCVTMFVNMQMETIKHNKDLFRTDWLNEDVEQRKQLVCQTAIQLMRLRRIQANQCIVKSGALRGRTVSHVKLRPRLLGSYSERKGEISDASKPSFDRKQEKRKRKHLYWRKIGHYTFEDDVNFVFGKTLSTITLSLFCDTELLMKLHRTSKNDDKQITVSNSLNIDFIVYEAIAEFAINLCGEIYELDLGFLPGVSFAELFALHKKESSVPNVKKIDMKSNTNFNYSILLTSFLNKSYNGFRELSITRKLLNVVAFVLKSLSTGAYFGILLPSALTRFISGLIWVLCQCFEEYAFIAGNIVTDPGVFLFLKRRNEQNRWIGVIERAVQAVKETEDPSFNLLEIIPIHLILQDTGFLQALRSCNHQVLKLRTAQPHKEFIL